MAWYRPADTVTFIPATPGGKLTEQLREVLQEEGKRLNLVIKAVEQGGVSLKRKLTGGDLTAGKPCKQPDCELCRSGLQGCCHRRAGVVYKGTCNICEQNNMTATYYGESGFYGYYGTNIHKKEIMTKDLENAFAKHLQIYHPEHEGDPTVFNITVIKTFSKPMPRQCIESVYIHNNEADIKMNSKTQFRQPAIPRVITTREPPGGDGWEGGGRRGEGEGEEEEGARLRRGGGDNRAEPYCFLNP